MARAARAKASPKDASSNTPTKPQDQAAKPTTTTTKTSRNVHNAQRRKLYRRAKRAQQMRVLKSAAAGAAVDDPTAKLQLSALRGVLYRPWRRTPKDDGADAEKLAALERLVGQQQDELRELRRALGTAPEGASSPAKVREQLLVEISQQPEGSAHEPDQREELDEEQAAAAVLEVEEVEEASSGAGLEAPVLLPSVEEKTVDAVDSNTEAVPAADKPDTPSKANGEEAAGRGSSAESNAGTPRNVRRSPRKRTVKRRSFAGHTY